MQEVSHMPVNISTMYKYVCVCVCVCVCVHVHMHMYNGYSSYIHTYVPR